MTRSRSVPAILALLAFALVALAPAADARPHKRKAHARKQQVHRFHGQRIRTHADPRRAFPRGRRHARARASANSLGALPATWCTSAPETSADDTAHALSNAPQIKVVYAHPTDGDNFNAYKGLIQADVGAIRERMADESGDTKSVRFDLGIDCSADSANAKKYVDIASIALPNAASHYNGDNAFDLLLDDLDSRLPAPPEGARWNYVVYADGIAATGASGQASLLSSSGKGYGNPINDGDHVAFVYGFGGADFVGGAGDGERRATFLHELSHTIGAVQNDAPHSSGGFHCFDEADIMCYDDGGPYFTAGNDIVDTCTPASADAFDELYDCGQQDYFNPSPASGTYLATHWNVYDSVFLCAVSECDSQLAPPTAALSVPSTIKTTIPATFSVSASRAIAHYEWTGDQNTDVPQADTGSTASQAITFYTPGSHTLTVRATAADGTYVLASATFDVAEAATPTPAFSVSPNPLVAGQIATLDASATSDPDHVITSYSWGVGSTGIAGGASPLATFTPAAAGPLAIALRVDYPAGFSVLTKQFSVLSQFDSGGTGLPGSPSGGTPQPAGTLTLVLAKPRLAQVKRKGLVLTAGCPVTCRFKATVSVSKRLMRKLKLKTRVIATGSATVSGANRTVLVKAPAAVRKRLKRVKKLAVAFTATLTPASGGTPLAVKRSLVLR